MCPLGAGGGYIRATPPVRDPDQPRSEDPAEGHAAPASPAPASPAGEQAAGAGRGVLWISGAKIVFVLLGFAVQFGLPRALETPSEFGLLSAAMAFTAILTNALSASMVQTTSKLVAEAKGLAVARTIAVRHGVLGLILAGALLGAADLLGGRVLHNPALVPLLRLASVVVLAYSVYATAIGALNGAQRFERQAQLDATFSTARTLGLLGGGLALSAALSAMAGFAAAAVTMALIGAAAARLHAAPTGRVAPLEEHLRVLVPIALYQLFLNGLLQLDLEILMTGATLAARESGLSADDAALAAAREAGLYRVAQTLAFVPYQLMTSVTLVLFPIVARASSAGDDEGVRRAVGAALRFSLIFVVGLLAPLAGGAAGAVHVAFPATYDEASSTVPVLAAGQVFFALGVVQATVLVSRGLLWRTVLLVLGTALVSAGCNVAAWWLAPDALRTATAIGTALGGLAIWVGTWLALRGAVGPRVAPATVVRVILAATAAVVVARALPQGDRLSGLAALLASGLAYLVVLAISRELGAEELSLVRRALGGRGRPRA